MSLDDPSMFLARTVAARQPGDRFRIWLSMKHAPHAIVAPLGDDGAAFDAAVAATGASGRAVAGAAIVDDDGRFVLCGPEMTPALLKRLARLIARHAAAHPALVPLTHAGVITTAAPTTTDAEIRRIGLRTPPPHRDAGAWDAVTAPSVAAVAAALGQAGAGAALWYALAPDATQPLLLQPLSDDPFGLRLSEQVAAADGDVVRRGCCVVGVDGVLDFDGGPLDPDRYAALAVWALELLNDHPDLARLAGARFGRAVPLPDVWEGISPPLVAGSIQEVADALSSDESWFWLGDGRLTVLPTEQDPDGARFRERMAGLGRQHPDARPIVGVLRQLAGERFLFTARSGTAARWQAQLSRFLQAHRGAHPALAALERARFARVSDNGVTDAAVFYP